MVLHYLQCYFVNTTLRMHNNKIKFYIKTIFCDFASLIDSLSSINQEVGAYFRVKLHMVDVVIQFYPRLDNYEVAS